MAITSQDTVAVKAENGGGTHHTEDLVVYPRRHGHSDPHIAFDELENNYQRIDS